MSGSKGKGKKKGFTSPVGEHGPSPRIARLQKQLKKEKLDAMLVGYSPDVRYLSRFSGSAGSLLVTRKGAFLLTDGRYDGQAQAEVYDGVVTIIDRAHHKRLKEEKIVSKGMKVGFQAGRTTVAGWNGMKRAFGKKVELVPADGLIRSLVAIKTESEVDSIRKAANIAARVYREILEFVKPGMREMDVAAEISYRGRLHGSEGDAFDIIVASGERSALPHGRASARKLQKGDMITLDYGCIVDGLNSDMTRTFALGEPGAEARKVYRTVLESERSGVAAARAGLGVAELDRVCRQVIEEAGYGNRFTHGTGHGLGIDVHEFPGVSSRAPEELKLEAGMVVTIEPGIYIPGEFGVRIEDDVLIQEEGCRELTSPTRKLIVL